MKKLFIEIRDTADPRGGRGAVASPQTSDEIFCFAQNTDFRTNWLTAHVVKMQKAFTFSGRSLGPEALTGLALRAHHVPPTV